MDKIICFICPICIHLHQHKPHSLHRSIPVAAVFLEGVQQFGIDDVDRRHLNKGQQAMVTAMAYPETQQGKKRTSELNSEVSGRYVNQARYVLRNNFTPEGQKYPDRCLAVMAERIQARAIIRCGELLKQIEPQTGKNNQYEQVKHDGAVILHSRTEAATQAGLSERQKVTALRVAMQPDYPLTILGITM